MADITRTVYEFAAAGLGLGVLRYGRVLLRHWSNRRKGLA